MGVLDPVKTLAMTVDEVRQKINNMYSSVQFAHTDIFQNVWNNPDFGHRDIIKSFGTDAKAIFEASALQQASYAKANPQYVPLQPKEPVYFHDDGSAFFDNEEEA